MTATHDERDELHIGPPTSKVPVCDLCWAREHVDDNPDRYVKEHPDPPVMVLGYTDSVGQFFEAITICEPHFKDLKAFVRGLNWEAFQ